MSSAHIATIAALLAMVVAHTAPASAAIVNERVEVTEQYQFNGPTSPLQTVTIGFDINFDDGSNGHPAATAISSSLGGPISLSLSYQYEGYPTEFGLLTVQVDAANSEYMFFIDDFGGNAPHLTEWAMPAMGAMSAQGGALICAGDLVIESIPEPGTLSVLALALSAAVGFRAKRRSR